MNFIFDMRKYMRFISIVLMILLVACGKKESAETPVTPVEVKPAKVDQVVALGRIEPEGRIVSLAGEVSGIVDEVLVTEGQTVTQGTPLLKLKHELQTAKLQQARSQYATQLAQIESDKTSIEIARIELKNQAQTLARIKSLVSQKAETQQLLDDTQSSYEQQKAQIKRLEQLLTINQKKLAELQAAIAQAEAELNQRVLYAPSDGRLLRLELIAGDAFQAGTTVGDFAPKGRTSALCEVDELFAAQMKPGLKAYVRLLGKKDTLASGTISYVGAYLKRKTLLAEIAGDAEDRRVREVRILLDNADQLLFNTRVECIIQL
jgi:multidrug efflux pump subunit AcrA (membrane-fusion protein)